MLRGFLSRSCAIEKPQKLGNGLKVLYIANMGQKKPTKAQMRYLMMGKYQAGGKLPLFDRDGQMIKPTTIKSCVESGWAEPWFNNPIKPDWLVCRLTDEGRQQIPD